jgi:hypothetical protein
MQPAAPMHMMTEKRKDAYTRAHKPESCFFQNAFL